MFLAATLVGYMYVYEGDTVCLQNGGSQKCISLILGCTNIFFYLD